MRRKHRITAVAASLAMTIGALGVPLPSGVVKTGGESFPCQNCPCGCADAQTCWRDCCCYTNVQKVAWAEKNGVRVPIFVIEAARHEQTVTAKKPPCCQNRVAANQPATPAQPACCRRRQTPTVVSSCCESTALEATATCSDANHVAATSPKSQRGVVLLMSALKCRGISVSIGLLPPSLPPRDFTVGPPPVAFSDLAQAPAILYSPPFHDVATPPPDAPSSIAS